MEMEMEKSKLLMYRRAVDTTQNQVFIFNSPIGSSDQELIVYQKPGHCVVYKREHLIINNPANYQSPTKRSFLNECIRQVYLINGLAHQMHWDHSTLQSTRQELWQQVDACLKPENLRVRTSLQRVKRQLFRVSRRNRKSTHPKRSQSWGNTKAFHFKPLRPQIGRKNIRRGFLWHTRRTVLEEMLRENLQREMVNTPAVCQRILGAVENIPDISPAVIERLTQRAKRMEDMYVTDQLRRAVENHRIMMEESVRSILYAKQLFSLIQRHEENQGFQPGCC
ncbi:hypothetical protein KR222_006944 [Zaprionus bogoriensis]|nr:hypothetical protein KR222_006944 [Zaprionus bogoriensis]